MAKMSVMYSELDTEHDANHEQYYLPTHESEAEEDAPSEHDRGAETDPREVEAAMRLLQEEMERVNQLRRRVDEEARQLQEERRHIEEAKARLEEERSAWEQERTAMDALLKTGDEVVRVNAGGTIFQARRSTLCQVPGSMLSYMFSGRWDQGLLFDDTGAVFVEASPEVFQAVLSHLRSRLITEAPIRAVPHLSEVFQEELHAFLLFVGLAECVPKWDGFDASRSRDGVQISNHGRDAAWFEDQGDSNICFGTEVVSSGTWRWDVRVDRARSGNMLIGVAHPDLPAELLYDRPHKSWYVRFGLRLDAPLIKAGDIVTVALDVDRGIVELIKDGVQISAPRTNLSGPVTLVVAFMHSGDKVTLCQPELRWL